MRFCLMVLLLSVLMTACKKQDDTIGVKDWLVVPVFYATNRAYDGANGEISYSDEPNNKGLLFGVKNVVLPKPTDIDLTEERLQRNCWRLVHAKYAGQTPDVREFPLPNNLFASDKIVKAFKDYASTTGASDSVIFVHGCCANFETSMKRAAKVAAHMESPVLLYDWVSPVGFRSYLQNETRVRQTTDDFCRFLSRVDSIADPGSITLLGHSMGAQFVDEALVRRAILSTAVKQEPYREVILSNADVDARSFLKHAADISANANKVRIYISSKDQPLRASALAHGGYERLGEPDKLVGQLVGLKATDVIDISEAASGHEIPFAIVAGFHQGDQTKLNQFNFEKITPGYLYLKKSVNGQTLSVHNNSDSGSCVACKYQGARIR